MFDAVYGLNALQYVFNGIVDRVLSGFQSKALVAHILQSGHLFYDLFLRQFLSGYVFVFPVIRTVHAAVDTVIGQIKGRKHNNPVSVEILFNLFSQFVNLLVFLLYVAVKQYGCLPVGESLSELCLLKDLVNKLFIVLICLSVGKCLLDFLMGNKFLCFQ